MMDWDDYRFILALERAGTIRGAAKSLGVDHSTVSRKLAWLNSKSPAPVFERFARGYQITDSGRLLLEAAMDMEAIALSADRQLRANNHEALSGKVTLSVSQPIAQYLLFDYLSGFATRFPDIELCLDASEATVDLDKSEADLVIRTGNNPLEHLVGRRVFPYFVGYYAHRDYLAQTPMEDYVWVGTQQDETFPEWVKASPFPHAPVKVRTTGYHTRFVALQAKMGLARAACFMADTHPELVRLRGTEPFPTLDFWVLTHPDLRQSPRIRAVMDDLVQVLRDKRDLIKGRQEISSE